WLAPARGARQARRCSDSTRRVEGWEADRRQGPPPEPTAGAQASPRVSRVVGRTAARDHRVSRGSRMCPDLAPSRSSLLRSTLRALPARYCDAREDSRPGGGSLAADRQREAGRAGCRLTARARSAMTAVAPRRDPRRARGPRGVAWSARYAILRSADAHWSNPK